MNQQTAIVWPKSRGCPLTPLTFFFPPFHHRDHTPGNQDPEKPSSEVWAAEVASLFPRGTRGVPLPFGGYQLQVFALGRIPNVHFSTIFRGTTCSEMKSSSQPEAGRHSSPVLTAASGSCSSLLFTLLILINS